MILHYARTANSFKQNEGKTSTIDTIYVFLEFHDKSINLPQSQFSKKVQSDENRRHFKEGPKTTETDFVGNQE